MNYAKLSEAAIVGGAGCVKGSQPWSPPTILHQPLTLPMAESRLICAPANGQQQDMEEGEEGRGGPGHLVTGGLSWRDTPATTSTLFITVIYRGHRQGDPSWYVRQPRGNIITGQRLARELPFQHSGQRQRVLFCKHFVCWCQARPPAQFETSIYFLILFYTQLFMRNLQPNISELCHFIFASNEHVKSGGVATFSFQMMERSTRRLLGKVTSSWNSQHAAAQSVPRVVSSIILNVDNYPETSWSVSVLLDTVIKLSVELFIGFFNAFSQDVKW